jgi:hypothetical protein
MGKMPVVQVMLTPPVRLDWGEKSRRFNFASVCAKFVLIL